jgi:hypothetical protein
MPRSIVVGIVLVVVGLILMLGLAHAIPHPGDVIVWWVGLLIAVVGAIYAVLGVIGLVDHNPRF